MNAPKGINMRKWNCWPILLGCLTLPLCSCSSKPTEAPPPAPEVKPVAKGPRPARPAKEEIIGKWQRTDAGKEKEVLVVSKDGQIKKGEPGYQYSGKYEFLDENTLEFKAKREGSMAEQYTKWTVQALPETLTVKVAEATSRVDDIDSFRETSDDTLRKGAEEHYKRVE
jgi:hypothetical protein